MNYVNEISKSLVTIREMLTDRGLNASDIASLGDDEIAELMDSRARFSVFCESCDTLIIFDISSKLVWKDTIKACEDENKKLPMVPSLLLVVVRDSAELKKGKVDVDHPNYQIFGLQELQFNLSHHHLVFKHELIVDEAVIKQVMENYQLKSLNQLPNILKTDAQAKYLNAKPGNLVRIHRISPTCGVNIVYRYVQ